MTDFVELIVVSRVVVVAYVGGCFNFRICFDLLVYFDSFVV